MSTKINAHNGFSSRAEVKLLAIFFPLLNAIVLAVPVSATEAVEDWSGFEQEMALEQRALEVNEGKLQVLDKPPEAAAHNHHNRLMLTEQSLVDGWVTMYQCHSDLDKVPAMQIVYNKDAIRDIKLLSSQNIGSVRIEGHTVQMTDIGVESKICISADKRALSFENGRYYLRLGPFMRRFLDGYYPMHVQVEVCFPAFLKLLRTSPVGFAQHTRDSTSYAEIDIWIVGKLDIELEFTSKLPRDQ